MDSSLSQPRPVVLIGFLGTKLDRAFRKARWERWRPSVDICRHDDLEISRFELLIDERFAKLAQEVKTDIESVSPGTEVRLHNVPFKDPWDFAEVYSGLRNWADINVLDEEREDYLVHITTGSHVQQICLFLMTETRRFPARLIQTSPAGRSRRSDPGSFAIIDLDLSRYDELAARFEMERREGVSFLKAGIETRNEKFNARMDRMEEVALGSSAPILLTGPTGVGKTHLARRIHELKRRNNLISGAFVEVNCATLRGDSAISTLFGHEKGAFTGAASRREGLLLAAHNGLLFLDEIGELGLDEQAMLLRALEDGIFQPLGSDRTASSSFQLIAGTNRDLPLAVRTGKFREDLLARIDLWSFELPPLRERLEDIEPNLEFELDRLSRVLGRRLQFNRDAREAFMAFATAPDSTWNANFRDFGAALTRMGTLARGGRINRSLVIEETERLRAHWTQMDGQSVDGDAALIARFIGREPAEQLDLFDRAQLAETLRVCEQSRSLSQAGRKLFAVSRTKKASNNDATRLSKYLARFGLRWADFV